MTTTPLAVLDLVPVSSGSTAAPGTPLASAVASARFAAPLSSIVPARG